MNVSIRVDLCVAQDFPTQRISAGRKMLAAKEAVRRALKVAQVDGLDYPYSDVLSMSVMAIEVDKPKRRRRSRWPVLVL